MIAVAAVGLAGIARAMASERPADAEVVLPSNDWRSWVARYFPSYATKGYAPHHVELWEWFRAIREDAEPQAFVSILPRGGAKSTTAELGCVYLAARGVRHYGWYVSETQAQADAHVGNVGAMLGIPAFAEDYPSLAAKEVNQFGVQRAWKRNRLWTAGNFVVDALGLDTASRGVKLDDRRPDFIVFDDIDSQEDGPEIVAKKIATITQAILPAGNTVCAVLFIQNLIHDAGVAAKLAGVAEVPADFLADRIVSGPHPALIDPEYEALDDGTWRVVRGTPTWEGQDLDACNRQVRRFGYTAFRLEAQHEVELLTGSMFGHLTFRRCDPSEVPDLVTTVVWVDPAVTDKKSSDSHAIQADGLAKDGTIYRLYSWERVSTPLESMQRAILVALDLDAEHVGVETDQGGDTWEVVYNAAWDALRDGEDTERYMQEFGTLFGPDGKLLDRYHVPAFDQDKAGAGHGSKAHRAQQMLTAYERGAFIHVRPHHVRLERSLARFPIRKPFDLCLAPGTLIETEHGPVPIERVSVGDMVWTRRGLRPVVAAGLSMNPDTLVRVEFNDGRTIEGTRGHPVWTENRGWVGLDSLYWSDTLDVWKEKRSSTEASPTFATLPPSNDPTACTTHLSAASAPVRFTDTSTKITMGQYHRGEGGTYTTGTTTHPTTSRRTSYLLPLASIESITGSRGAISMLSEIISLGFARLRSLGIEVTRVLRGTESTASNHGKAPLREPSHALSAAGSSQQDSRARYVSAQPVAAIPTIANMVRARWPTTIVHGAGSPSLCAQTAPECRDNVVPVRALRVSPIGNGPVYNLTVGGVPEFYANGVLVHNCDAAFYAWNDLTDPQRGYAAAFGRSTWMTTPEQPTVLQDKLPTVKQPLKEIPPGLDIAALLGIKPAGWK